MLRMSKPGGAVNIYFGVNSHQCLGNLSVVSKRMLEYMLMYITYMLMMSKLSVHLRSEAVISRQDLPPLGRLSSDGCVTQISP